MLLIAVGKDRRGPTFDLVHTYLERCSWRIELIDIAPRNQGDAARRIRDEAEKIRRAIPESAAVAVLDERGEDLSSRALAKRIDDFRTEGRQTLAFVIGGADGLDPSLVKWADFRIAFGRATWPHRLVRAMLAEQLYRASTILSGHPYHRD
jgi:23S rRNA (pseudouridine1915-N3)-methyltransferase